MQLQKVIKSTSFIFSMSTIWLYTSCLCLLVFASGCSSTEGLQPNVVLIYGDDVGFADIGVNGSEMIPTPNTDRLAAEGINFIDAHCPAATCSPSRFAMLTGNLAIRRNVRILGPRSSLPIHQSDNFHPYHIRLPKIFAYHQ